MTPTAIITAVASLILIRLLYSFEGKLLALADQAIALVAAKIEEKTGRKMPAEWTATVDKLIHAGVDIANQVFDKSTLGAIFNRVRQGKGDEIAGILAAQLEKADVAKKLSDQLSPEALAAFNEARQALAIDHVQAAIVPHASLMSPGDVAGQRAVDTVMSTEKLVPMIQAAVVVAKAAPAPAIDAVSAMRAKNNIQSAVEELRAKLAK